MIRGEWEDLAGAPVSFAPVFRVAVSPRLRLCPPGWAGLVVIGDAVIATAPDEESAGVLWLALAAVPVTLLSDADKLGRELDIAEMLGPATLVYLDPAGFRPKPGPDVITVPGAGNPVLERFFSEMEPPELDESGISDITSPVFAIFDKGRIVAAAGYRDWPGQMAHLSVLTAARARSRGLGSAAAAAAVSHALSHGRLPQWRARPRPSRRVARSLGFTELGSQVSIRLTTAAKATVSNQNQSSG